MEFLILGRNLSIREITKGSGVFQVHRRKQLLTSVVLMVQKELTARFYTNKSVKELMPSIEKAVVEGKTSATLSVHQLLGIFDQTSIKIK